MRRGGALATGVVLNRKNKGGAPSAGVVLIITPPNSIRPRTSTVGPCTFWLRLCRAALPDWTPMSTRPFAVGGRLAAPSVCIAAEPRSVGAPLVGALGSAMPTGEGRHEACPYVYLVIESRKV